MPQINITIKENLLNRLDVEATRRSARSGKSLSRSAIVAKIIGKQVENG